MSDELLYTIAPNKKPIDPKHLSHLEIYVLSDLLDDDPEDLIDVLSEMWEDEPQYHTRRKWVRALRFCQYFVIYRVDGDIQGFLMITDPNGKHHDWEIHYVTVREEYRHRGAATAMVMFATNQATEEGIQTVTLTSRPELQALYESKCGFTVVG